MLGETVTAASTIVSPNRVHRGARGLLRQSTGLQREGTSGELGLDPLCCHCLLSLCVLRFLCCKDAATQRGRPDMLDRDALSDARCQWRRPSCSISARYVWRSPA